MHTRLTQPVNDFQVGQQGSDRIGKIRALADADRPVIALVVRHLGAHAGGLSE